MGKYFRIFMAIIAVLSLVLAARNKAAGAANSEAGARQSSLEQAELSMSLDTDDCGKDKDKKKDKDKCKDKEDDNGEDDDEDDKDGGDDDDDGGTVQPPDDELEACERGDYSVGGIATLDIRNLRGRDCLQANTRDPDPILDQLPGGAGTFLSDVVVLQLPSRGGNVKICFAVPPGEQVKIYSSAAGSWKALKTKIKNGLACADVPASGSYALAGH